MIPVDVKLKLLRNRIDHLKYEISKKQKEIQNVKEQIIDLENKINTEVKT